MSGANDSNNNHIRVRRDTLVTIEDGRAGPQDRSRATDISGPSKRPHSSLGFSSPMLISDMLRSDTLRRRIRMTSERDDINELAKFLREAPPPPGNYMSVPEPVDEKPEKTKKRSILWPFRRKSKKEKPKRPPRLMILPDSAVAGTTIDGHRHIAISIPIEYDHLDLVGRGPAVPPASLPKEDTGKQEAKVEPGGTSQIKRLGVSRSLSDLLSPVKESHGLTEESRERTQPGTGGRSRSHATGSPVGADDINSAPAPALAPELTALQGSTPASTAMQQPPNQDRALRRRDTFGNSPVGSERRPDSRICWSIDSNLLRERPSTRESFYTSSSDLIFSDAETVSIPSLESSSTSQAADAETESESYHTPPCSREASGVGANSSPEFNFSALNNQSTSPTSTMPDFDLVHPPFVPGLFAHALLDITSSPSPSPESPQSLHIAPVTVVAEVEPSPSGQVVWNPEGEFVAVSSHPSSSTSSTPTTNPYSHHSPTGSFRPITDNPPFPIPPRPPNSSYIPSLDLLRHPSRTYSHAPGTQRSPGPLYHNLDSFAARLRRLEHAAIHTEDCLHALVPLLEHLVIAPPRRTLTAGPSASGTNSLHMAMTRPRSQSWTHTRTRSRRGSGRRSSSSGTSSLSLSRLWSGEHGGMLGGGGILVGQVGNGGGEGGGTAAATAASSSSVVDSFDRERVGSGGLWHQQSQEVERGLDINDVSWLRSASASRSRNLLSGLGSREMVLKAIRSGESLGHASGSATGGRWGATFAGREAAAFAREQQRRRDEVYGSLSTLIGKNDNRVTVVEDLVSDPRGLGELERVMRDLVLGKGPRDVH